MRQWMMLVILLSSEATLACPYLVTPVAALPFDFFYDDPSRVAPRARRLSPRSSRRPPVRTQPVSPTVEIPLPVPRPRFAQDPVAAAPSLKPEGPPVATTQVEPKPQQVAPAGAALPAADIKPAIAASGATTSTSPRKPDDDSLCPGRLKTQAIMSETVDIGPQPDARCTVAEPVKLTGLTLPDGGAIDFPDRPVIACATAEQFSAYVRDLLSPLAKGTYGARVGAVWTGPGLECRSRDHIFGAKLSAHGQGLAVDIAEIKLSDGHAIAVGTPQTAQDNSFESAARAGACGYFHTVLGPGSDSYHRTHWHFDLEVRGAKGDTKYCH